MFCEFCERKTSPASLAIVLFLTDNTDEQNTQGSMKMMAPPPTPAGPSPFPSPEGKGSDHRDTPIRRMCVSIYYLTGSLVGVTSHTTSLPAGEGLGEGPLSCGLETVRKNALLTLCALWEKKISFVRDITFKLVTLSICYHVAKPVYLLPCLLVHLWQNLFTCYPVYLSAKDIPCLPINSSTR